MLITGCPQESERARHSFRTQCMCDKSAISLLRAISSGLQMLTLTTVLLHILQANIEVHREIASLCNLLKSCDGLRSLEVRFSNLLPPPSPAHHLWSGTLLYCIGASILDGYPRILLEVDTVVCGMLLESQGSIFWSHQY